MVLLLSTGWHRIHGKTVQARRMHFTFQRGRRLEAMNRIRDRKRVGDENASFDSMARHTFTDNDPAYEITEGKNFDYVIRQQLLPGNYSSFELKDVLDSCLKYRSASVMTALGNDVTRFFNIENRSNTIVFRADSNFLKNRRSI